MDAFESFKRGSVQVQRAAMEVKEKLGPRHILVGLLTIGFFFCGVVEQSATVALLANSSSTISAEEFAEYVENTSYITRYCAVKVPEEVKLANNETESTETTTGYNDTAEPDVVIIKKTISQSVMSLAHIEIPMSIEEETESIMREAFMWGSLVSPLPASRVAARVGAERLFGYAVLGAGLAALLVPAAWLSPSHVALRFIQGICVGSTWPAAHMMAVSWFKPKHYSMFVSCYTALNLGYAVVGVLGTPLVRLLGPDSLCYLITLLLVIWWILWWHLVEETLAPKPKSTSQPGKHDTGVVAYNSLPWRKLLLSGPVWACAVAVMGSQWADATLMLGVFKYLRLVYGFSTAHEHMLSSLPHVGHFFAGLLFGYTVDRVRESGIVSTTTARKLFCYISHFLPAAIMFVLGYTGCDPTAPAAMYTAALVLSAATPSGPFASAIDLAPNFAGTIFGLCQTLGAAGCLSANYVVREGLHGSIAGSWRLVFVVSSAVLLTTSGIFMLFGSGSMQSWNALGANGKLYGQENVDQDIHPEVINEEEIELKSE